MSNADFIQRTKNSILFAEGWLYRDKENLLKHREVIKKIFTPQKPYLLEVDKTEKNCLQKAPCIIGVHIRRGDYKTFNDGLWYYSDQVYSKKMKALELQLAKENIQCVFYICSNEEIDKSHFTDFKTYIEPNNFIVDLYMLARCTYIIGPPSTYSAWASFYGNVPLFHIQTPESEIHLENFAITII